MTSSEKKLSILTVCNGNINRSPTAEVILQHLAEERGLKWDVDSCGTGGGSKDWYKPGGVSRHTGESPAPKMAEVAAERGYQLTHKARPLTKEDIESRDLLVAMAPDNVTAIMEAADYWGLADVAKAKTVLVTDWSSDVKVKGKGIPDPFAEEGAQAKVLDILEDSCGKLVDDVTATNPEAGLEAVKKLHGQA